MGRVSVIRGGFGTGKTTVSSGHGRLRARDPREHRRFFLPGPALPMQWEGGVQGTITSRDVFIHSFTILRLWGPGFYLRCVKAIARRRPCTFLDVLAEER